MPNNIETSNAVRQAAEETANPEAIVTAALGQLQANPDALYQEHVIAALKLVRQNDPVAYARLINRAKGHKGRLEELTAAGRENRDDSNLAQLIALARESSRLGHAKDGKGVAIVTVKGIRQTWYIGSYGYAEWLRAAFYKSRGSGVGDTLLTSAIATLSSIGNFEGEEFTVHMRCAKHGDDYYIDLCDDSWQAIRLNADGWSVVSAPPVLFTRTRNMRPLPTPVSGRIDELWQYANVPELLYPLALTWLIDSFRPDTPFSILELCGEQGSAKSSTQRCLRDLTDPNMVALRGKPKMTEDIYIAANNSWVVSFENLSSLTSDQQDALCTLATGGGFASRQLYSNGDEFVMETKRPVMLNGISPVATRPDLIERVISIECPSIPAAQRRDEQSLAAEWQDSYPAIFGGLLDLFSAALRHLPTVNLDQKFRMADFQLLGEAVCMALDHPPGYFTELYEASVREGVDRSLETYGVANALQVFMAQQKNKAWEGTVLTLKSQLEGVCGQDKSAWPKSARGLSGQLARIRPGLRQRGIQIEHLGHSRAGAKLRITLMND
ncbi:MAG: hypothetical protein IPM27_02430 [Nitrosomonadales bacterium]|nr:hypothetical protein [Nitrosomonadales bacterium]